MPTARPDSYTVVSGADLYAGIAAPSPPPPPPPPPAPAPALTFTSGASSGTAGGASIAGPTISAPGGNAADVSWALTSSPAGQTATPASGTLAPGASVTPTLNAVSAAIYAISVANNSGGTVNGAASPGSAGNVQWYAPTPPPPPPAPSPAPSVGTGGDATFALTSTAGATNESFAVGMALSKGQFPSTSGIVASGAGLLSHQVDIRTTWADGSAKFALVSGRATIAAAASQVITLRQGTATTGTALTESDLLASGVEATLQFGGGTVMTLSALIGVASASNSTGLTTAGRVRQLASGPQMSSWLYAARLSASNPHLIGWMEVRFYGGTKVHVLPWVENGWTRVAGPSGQAGTLTFTLGGTTRFNQANVHIGHHARVAAQDVAGVGYWAGTAPDLYAAPDPNYLQATRVVPAYFPDTSPASASLDALAQVYSPTLYGQLTTSARDGGGNATDNGDFDAGMSNAGYHAGIGLLPAWDAFYLTSNGDKRAWNAVVANAIGYGRYGVHHRDELTLLPVNPSDVPNKTLPQGSIYRIADVGANQYGGAETLPTATNYDPTGININHEYWAQTHHPSAGFLAYLLTGQEFFLELSQFVAGTCFLRQNNLHREYGLGLQKTQLEQVRGQAWGLRSIFQAAAISRDGSALKTGFSAIAANNVSFYSATYITGVLGVCGSYGITRNTGNFRPDTTSYRVNAFEYDFSVGAWGYGLDLEPVSGATLTLMRDFAKWHAQWPVVRLGPLGDANTFGFNCAGRNNFISVAPGASGSQWDTNTGWYANPGEMFAETPGGSNATNTINTIGSYADEPGNASGNFPDATSYWGNLQIALMYAVELGVTGATAAYQRMVGASNWADFESSAAIRPGYAHRPRNVFQWGLASATGSLAGDVWTPGKDAQGRVTKASWATVPTGRWIEVAGTRIDTQLNAKLTSAGLGWTADQLWGPVAQPQASLFQSWSGFAQDTALGRLWSFNGGHSDGFNNGLYRFDTNKMTWTIECLPSNRSLMTSTYLSGGNATFDPDSHALALANFNANNASGTTTGTLVPALNGTFYDEVGSDPNKPTARHSYQGMVYAPEIGAAGSVFMHARRLWRYDIASGRWVFKRLVNDQVRANGGAAPTATGLIEIHAAEAALAIWDEAAQKVLCSASGSAGAGAYAYNWGTQSWASWSGSYGLNYNDAAHVRVGRMAIAFRLPRADSPVVYPGLVWQHNLDTGTTVSAAIQFGGGLDISQFIYSFYDGTGMVYVPTLNRYWICTRMAGGMTWLQLDPTTTPWTLSPLTFANAQPVQQILLLSRVQWIEDMKAVIVFDHCFSNAFVCKP